MSLFFSLFTFTINLCRHWKKVETVNDLVLSEKDKLQTHRTVREISREMGYSSVVCISVPDYYGRPVEKDRPLYFHPVVSFYLLSIFFFSRLISAVAHSMSTILPRMVWP